MENTVKYRSVYFSGANEMTENGKRLILDGLDLGPLTPHEREKRGYTKSGLLFWVRNWGGGRGNLRRSVLTEREDTSMHVFSGGDRDGRIGYMYLLLFEGFRTGLLSHRSPRTEAPGPQIEPDRDEKTGAIILTITAIGAPVWSSARADSYPGNWENGFATGITWQDYLDGKRTKFISEAQQEAVLEILPDLFLPLRGSLSSSVERKMALSSELQQEISSGKLIADA